MEQKIIGYKAPYDLNGSTYDTAKKGTLYTPHTDNEHLYSPEDNNNYLSVPAAIVKTWEPVYEHPKYKEGEWVYVEFNTHTAVAKIKYVRGEKFFYSCNIHNDGTVWDDDFYVDEEGWNKTQGIATEEQKLQHFSAAAIKKGFVEGVRINTLPKFGTPTLVHTLKDGFFIDDEDGGFMSNSETGCVTIFDFDTIQWAEMPEQEKPSSQSLESDIDAVIKYCTSIKEKYCKQ